MELLVLRLSKWLTVDGTGSLGFHCGIRNTGIRCGGGQKIHPVVVSVKSLFNNTCMYVCARVYVLVDMCVCVCACAYLDVFIHGCSFWSVCWKGQQAKMPRSHKHVWFSAHRLSCHFPLRTQGSSGKRLTPSVEQVDRDEPRTFCSVWKWRDAYDGDGGTSQ